MRIVLAFDSFKGCMTAVEACAAAADGVLRLPGVEAVQCPLSDGGEGFAEAILSASKDASGYSRTVEATGPLFEKTSAQIVFLDGGKTAILESAQACGLGLVPESKRSASQTTTFGVGEMLAAAADAGAERIVIGLGGSATNDGGMGMLAALGWRFLDSADEELRPVGASLGAVESIKPGRRLHDLTIIAASDVNNPLFGPTGAAHSFAVQKGASPEEVEALDKGLERFAEVSAGFLEYDLSPSPGAGAAGGLGFALLAFLGAKFRPGAEVAIEVTRLESHLAGADLCLTGEGRTDYQTKYGKLPAAVAECSSRAGVPCVCLSGALGDGWRELHGSGFTSILSISQGPSDLAEALANAPAMLADAAEAVARVFI